MGNIYFNIFMLEKWKCNCYHKTFIKNIFFIKLVMLPKINIYFCFVRVIYSFYLKNPKKHWQIKELKDLQLRDFKC